MKYHKYTTEEDAFLISKYPTLGSVKTHKLFCQKYGSVTYSALQKRCTCVLHLRVNDIRKEELRRASSERQRKKPTRPSVPIGYVSKKSGMVKTENGWTRLGKMLNVPKGYYAIHLDNDISNNSNDNIAIVSMGVSMRMTKNNFWSQSKEITKTGILCCELEGMLNATQT